MAADDEDDAEMLRGNLESPVGLILNVFGLWYQGNMQQALNLFTTQPTELPSQCDDVVFTAASRPGRGTMGAVELWAG